MFTAVGLAFVRYSNFSVTKFSSSSVELNDLGKISITKLSEPTIAIAGAPRTYRWNNNTYLS